MNMKNFEDRNQLKNEFMELKQSKEETEIKLRQSENEVDELKSNNQLVEKNHKMDIQKIQNEEQARSDALTNLEKQYKALTAMNEQYRSSNQVLLSKLDFYQNETQYYNNLKNVLMNLGVDALDLKNTRLLSLSQSDRSLLFSHFGSDDKQVELVQKNRLQVDEIEEKRKQALENQRQAKADRDRILQIRAKNNPLKAATNGEPTINQPLTRNQSSTNNQPLTRNQLSTNNQPLTRNQLSTKNQLSTNNQPLTRNQL